VEAYTPVVHFLSYQHHIYVQSKKDLREEQVHIEYKVTEEDIQLIMQDWDPYWKIPANGTETEQPGNEEA